MNIFSLSSILYSIKKRITFYIYLENSSEYFLSQRNNYGAEIKLSISVSLNNKLETSGFRSLKIASEN